MQHAISMTSAPAAAPVALHGGTVVSLAARDAVFALLFAAIASVCGCFSVFMLVMAPMLKARCPPPAARAQRMRAAYPASVGRAAARPKPDLSTT